MSAAKPAAPIVILGGGIIGCSAAYFLSLLKPKTGIIIIEKLGIASCASGKAGGFLAREWGDKHTRDLHQMGYDLHVQLAKALNLTSYRTISTLQVTPGAARHKKEGKPIWLDGPEVGSWSSMGPSTAQVTPGELTQALFDAAQKNGVKLIMGSVEGVVLTETKNESDGSEKNENRKDTLSVRAVKVDGKEIEASQVLVALGPWSVLAESWFGSAHLSIPMQGLKSTSVALRPKDPSVYLDQPFALFCGEDSRGCHLEVYPRPDGDVYLCGVGGSQSYSPKELKELAPADVAHNASRVQAALTSFGLISNIGRDATVVAQQACLRPCADDARPMMGRIPNCDNAFIATGHNCWGILWGPISGKLMADLMTTGSCEIDLSAFHPGRFSPSFEKAKRSKHRG